jgi:hypothetical protein
LRWKRGRAYVNVVNCNFGSRISFDGRLRLSEGQR